jgi:hypothetical protein
MFSRTEVRQCPKIQLMLLSSESPVEESLPMLSESGPLCGGISLFISAMLVNLAGPQTNSF